MALTYHYRILPGKKGSPVKTPSIPVCFKGNSSLSLNVVALVDSGADCSIIPKGLAEVLNLNLSGPTQDSYGIAGSIKCIQSSVKIVLKQNHERYELSVPLLVSSDDYCPIILGRRAFFDNFKIVFDSKHEHVVLKKNGE